MSITGPADRLPGAPGQYQVPLRGRHRERQVLEQGFDAASAGRRAVTVLSGEPGIGKTRLLQHARQIAQALGWSTILVTPDVDSALTPLGALLDAATRARPPLLGRQDVSTVLRGEAPQYWLTRLLADGLEVAAGRTGVLVVVDDLQWLDAGSLGVVTALLRDAEGLGVHWVLATRSGVHGAAHRRFLHQIAALAPLVELHPLDVDDVDAITRDVLGSRPGPGIEEAVRRADGLPLLVLELLHGLAEEGLLQQARGLIDIDNDTLPERFGASTRERLGQVGPEALRIAQIGSLYGREFPLGGVLDVIGCSAVDAAPAVQELLDHGFVVDTGSVLTFRHDTVRAAAADSLSPSLRRAIAGEVLHRRLRAGESVAALAATIASVADAGDDASIELLFLAARQLSGTDMDGAAELVVRGARLAAGRPHHAEQIASLLPVVLAGGRTEDAATIGRSLTPLLAPDARARVGLTMARQLTESDFDGAINQTATALAIPGISRETRVQLLAVRALNFANKADADGLRASLLLARSVADDDRDALAVATLDATESVLLFNENRFDEAEQFQRRALHRAVDAGEVPSLWLPEGLWMTFMRNSLGHGEEALRATADGLAEARAARNVVAEAYWMMVRTRVLYDLARLDEARDQAETTLDLAARLGLGDFTNATAGVVLHRIALHTGDVELLRTARPLIRQLADGVGLTRTGRWTLAVEALTGGRFRDAHDHADLALASLREPIPSMTTPVDFADDTTLAVICSAVGDQESLDLIVGIAADRARLNPDNALVGGVADATRGIRDRSAADLLTAVERTRPVGQPLLTAWLLEIAGDLTDDNEAAADLLVESLHLYEDTGSTRDARRILNILRGRGVRKRSRISADGPLGLSVREHEVAERIAAGLTTQQIADDLMVSPHTVVTHIRHIFAKWDVNSRRDVARQFASRTSTARG